MSSELLNAPLLGPDGLIRDAGHLLSQPVPVKPDRYGAVQLVLAASNVLEQDEVGGIPDDMFRVLKERPGLALLNGLIYMNVLFAQALFGDRRTEKLNELALGYGMNDGAEEATAE